ncbi:MAG: class I SAM-dependent methyltransferase [Okeania sp. SIO3C4]|nr:class I SAM-dependent methyltransferase [Okeania sp. SIO3C4]
MLEQARKKNVYTALYRKILGEDLGFENDTYDACILKGVFIPKGATSCSLDEVIRIVKS